MNIFRLAVAYLRHYKKQTAALFIGIMVSAALLAGVGSLFASGKNAAKENARTEYGDWHYSMRNDLPWFSQFQKNAQGSGFQIEKYGIEVIRKVLDDPFEIQYVSADDGYLEMMGRKLLKGKMPETNSEMAMDEQTLRNLGIAETLGSEFELDGEKFTLCGILTEIPKKLCELQGDYLQVFVGPDLDYGTNGSFFYVKFRENKSVYQQLKAFMNQYGVAGSVVARNSGLVDYVGGNAETFSLREIGQALRDPAMGLPYVWGSLNVNEALTETAILIALGFFCVFIIYSIFQVSVLKRLSQYSVMQTLGMTDFGTFRILMLELLIIFVGAYISGCVLGNAVAMLVYSKTGKIFIIREKDIHTGVATSEMAAKLSVSDLPDPGKFHVDRQIILYGAVFLILFLAVISLVLVKKMKTLSLKQMMAQDISGRKKNRKIYSLKRENLTGILTKKFMFSRKGAFIGILFSLSIGSVIFLGATYVAENTRINNDLAFAADDGLGSDMQVYEASDQLSDVIPEQTVDKIREIKNLQSVLPVRYMLGEITLNDGMFKWPAYFAETAHKKGWDPDPEIMEKYNGQIVQTGEDDYLLKVNIYGYDDEMLKGLNEYLLEGEINPEQMRTQNTVIARTLMDGQGNYNGIDIKPGDALAIRTPEDPKASSDVLKFTDNEQEYKNQNLKISGIVSRSLGKVDTYIGNDSVDLIMTNEQMEKNFGVTGYQTISISLKDDADTSAVADELRSVTSDISKCMVKDYTGQIQAQNLYLNQQMMFFYGIAAVLLVISLIHILNSMQYLVAERKHEFSILQAMGITDSGFLWMLAKEGLRYGIYSSIVMVGIYFLVQKVLYYFMTKVYLYLHPQGMIQVGYLIGMVMLNLAICIAAMTISGKNILKQLTSKPCT